MIAVMTHIQRNPDAVVVSTINEWGRVQNSMDPRGGWNRIGWGCSFKVDGVEYQGRGWVLPVSSALIIKAQRNAMICEEIKSGSSIYWIDRR